MEDRPNSSRLIKGDYNRRTNDDVWSVQLSRVDAGYVNDGEDALRDIRKVCVREREEWIAIKKSIRGPDAKFAKEFEREWLRRERAATLLIQYNAGDNVKDWQTYYWPCELAPELQWCIGELVCRQA